MIIRIYTSLDNYKLMLSSYFKDEYYGKDMKNNYKFVENAIKRMSKDKDISNQEILDFINMAIKSFKEKWKPMFMSQENYFKSVNNKFK